MDFKSNPIKAASMMLVALLLIVLIFNGVSSSGENKRLKRAINDNLDKIEFIEKEKKALYEAIYNDSILIEFQKKKIDSLRSAEKILINNLNNFKNESTKIKNAYINSDVNGRIRKFSELASSD